MITIALSRNEFAEFIKSLISGTLNVSLKFSFFGTAFGIFTVRGKPFCL